MKLHIGCGKRKIHGWVNLDLEPSNNPDIVDDAGTLNEINGESVDVIYASHILEHLDRKNVLEALKRWHEVLKVNGKIMISVPDMEAVFAHYFYWKNLKLLYGFLGGGQKNKTDYHFSHFDFTTLKELLESVGFKDVKLYDRWETDVAFIDDYSAAFYGKITFPGWVKADGNMSFANGKLMSLNVEGIKK